LATLFGSPGSLIAGLFCTRILMRSVGASGPWRALAWVIIGILMCGLSYFVSFLGRTGASNVTHQGI
jgi:hypothetical protein